LLFTGRRKYGARIDGYDGSTRSNRRETHGVVQFAPFTREHTEILTKICSQPSPSPHAEGQRDTGKLLPRCNARDNTAAGLSLNMGNLAVFFPDGEMLCARYAAQLRGRGRRGQPGRHATLMLRKPDRSIVNHTSACGNRWYDPGTCTPLVPDSIAAPAAVCARVKSAPLPSA